MGDIAIKQMIEELIMYYEAAGFVDIYKKELEYKNPEEIRELYRIVKLGNDEEQF